MKDKSALKAVLWGLISAVMYFLVFSNQKAITEAFSQGGVFALAIIFTALLFSVVHGAFANYFIEAIGFKPVKQGGTLK